MSAIALWLDEHLETACGTTGVVRAADRRGVLRRALAWATPLVRKAAEGGRGVGVKNCVHNLQEVGLDGLISAKQCWGRVWAVESYALARNSFLNFILPSLFLAQLRTIFFRRFVQ